MSYLCQTLPLNKARPNRVFDIRSTLDECKWPGGMYSWHDIGQNRYRPIVCPYPSWYKAIPDGYVIDYTKNGRQVQNINANKHYTQIARGGTHGISWPDDINNPDTDGACFYFDHDYSRRLLLHISLARQTQLQQRKV